MDGDAALVVSSASPVEASILFCRVERICLPDLCWSRRLDVVVGVQQHGRCAGRTLFLAVHRRVCTVDLQQANILKTDPREEFHHEVS